MLEVLGGTVIALGGTVIALPMVLGGTVVLEPALELSLAALAS